MTAILGISAFYHDSAAALVVDGQIVAAAQEERFTRKKHDSSFPLQAVDYCLREAGLTSADLDYVGFYDKPLLKFDRLLETYVSFAPVGYRSFAKAMPLWLHQKLQLPRVMRKSLPGYRRRFVFPEHHESHAASAFYPSPFDQAAIITFDGVGEWATVTVGHGCGHKIELSHELRFPHSPGLLYSAFTYFCGFQVNSGEYKLMGLAPYGEPKYVDTILRELVDLKEDGSFRMDLSYFNYCQGLTMTSRKFAKLFGGPPRKPEGPLTQREMDLAASIQKVIEQIMLRIARFAHEQTGSTNLTLAGGVALNCVGNGNILREGPFEKIWVQPAAGDAGGALGAALLIWHQLLDQPRTPMPEDSQCGSLLGPGYSPEYIERSLQEAGADYQRIDDEGRLLEEVVDHLISGKVVGWMQGRMEFGPRALGARSILGDARNAEMQSTMNLKIKFRESFRPFAPSVIEEHTQDYFDLPSGVASPYMLLVANVTESRRVALDHAESLQGLDKVRQTRSEIPAVTHVDMSARLQTVNAQRYPKYHALLQRFYKRTGCPVLVNTSFNVRGEPIVCAPGDAYRCFMATDMDVLVIENFLLRKSQQPATAGRAAEHHLDRFALD
ncbi:MAG: hypothetical protein GC164_03030 [Phycisphaera sp.]|nr:hypothetical protein [Phycisphaera sp.]